MHQAILLLADGTCFRGWSSSPPLTALGELVFNTGMTGYQEIVSDPSYHQQIVAFTAPEIGNTGTNPFDQESARAQVSAILVRHLSSSVQHARSHSTFEAYLHQQSILCIQHIDTRALVRHLRRFGVMHAIASNHIFDLSQLRSLLQASTISPSPSLVATSHEFEWTEASAWFDPPSRYACRILVVDYGVKYNILRILKSFGASVFVVPPTSDLAVWESMKPDGVLLSNGPGDPSSLDDCVHNLQLWLSAHPSIPILGICMGHQLLALAHGASTFALKFGHRALNHPTGLHRTVEISSQNHGYAVKVSSLPKITHFNLHDGTIAGLSYSPKPYISVQYHPEASPGPHDAIYLFEHFLRLATHHV
uniref:Carbamoyl phosphate synthase small chain n=1 Tax=Cyanidiococcus yangmingshanensis TaxID=2690220 RepID=A0A7G5VUV8_9RHOD|nr:carbamoyl phosphate synthetase small subunit [Cyanidiococcus yangmingshanensis]QMX77475.1 carbamoyl phosphate synthetase small subunit [Cyanidiococcus yangmingshanensis]UNJ15926.1 carbamoyl-phosphate synthase arginine-specific small subunit [Cyanidioschyzonaceae sp. 3]WDB00384.1 carbamoyl-phosphate synthase arginine-specific small subunit [Cyanidiococcus yangmingshanensis]